MKENLLFFILLSLINLSNGYSQIYHESDKEGLRKILRTVGTDYYRQALGSPLITLENAKNFESYGLTESDTLTWYNSDEWIEKLYVLDENTMVFNFIEWSTEIPKKIQKVSFVQGVKESSFDLSYFTDLREVSIGIRYITSSPSFEDYYRYKYVDVDLSKNEKLQKVNLISVSLNKESFLLSSKNITYLSFSNSTSITVNDDFLQSFPKLETLIFENVSEELTFTNNPLLKYVGIWHSFTAPPHNVKKLDLRQCHKLEELYCSFGNLKELYISDQARLKTLNCSMNYLEYDRMPCNPVDNPVIENYIANNQYYDSNGYLDQNIENYNLDIVDLTAYAEFAGVKTTFSASCSDYPEDNERIVELEPGKFLIPDILPYNRFGVNFSNPCFGGATMYRMYNVVPKGTIGIESENSENPIILKTNTVDVNSTFLINVIVKGEVSLYNMSGKQIQNTILSVGDNYILSPPVSGIYIVKVILDNGITKTSKITVK